MTLFVLTPVAIRILKCFFLVALFALGDNAHSFQSPVNFPILTDAQKERLTERDALEKEAQQKIREGQLAEALVSSRKMLSIEQEVLGHEHADAVRSWEMIAQLQTMLEDFSGAKESRETLLKIQQSISGSEHWRTADAQRALQYLEVLQKLSSSDRQQLNEASRLNRTATTLYQEGKSADALPLFAQIVETLKRILGKNIVNMPSV